VIAEITWVIGALTRELLLFAGVGLLIAGLDDLLVDAIWAGRWAWRRATVYRSHPRATAATLPPPDNPGRIAIFIAAWHEADVIGRMLRAALARLEHDDYRIYVGTYPNDPHTVAAVQAVADPRIRLVGGMQPGPTTKAECLNRVWLAMLADEAAEQVRYKAIVLHDAEDVVHAAELRVFDRLIERFDVVQLPVLPLINREHGWFPRAVSSTYADEFADGHSRQLVVREAVGAGIPLAGVGCAIARDWMARVAQSGGGRPFDPTSLTEDYEIGLRIAAEGGRGAFVVMPARPNGELVAVRAYFPHRLHAAIRQKQRWITGIALAGWDRLRWKGGPAEVWMRLRDRRGLLAAFVLIASYIGSVLAGPVFVGWGWKEEGWPVWAWPLLQICGVLVFWRLAVRGLVVGHLYGWREGLIAMPRTVIANFIAVVAGVRALIAYRPGVVPVWDKTEHDFPDALPCD
jgi:bacteriophage N4 adsorption protein B